ncbi:MAG: helix-turn-helix domain-containing protein [Methylobacter sp.]|jgi:DNA-binding transcriptional ArsR family regulator|nr:helix-turn-helix domain-containing protein [Methylobacter sp.]
MDKQLATTLFESLASGIRLDVFRLLVKHAPTGLVAGEIATLLALPPTNLSFHLKAMTHAGLINVTQEGRYQRYRANLAIMQELIVYLTAECCTGHPEHCFESDSVSDRCDTEANLSTTQIDQIGD